jgi:hypothetical protein
MAVLLQGQVAGIISQDARQAKEKKIPVITVMAINSSRQG